MTVYVISVGLSMRNALKAPGGADGKLREDPGLCADVRAAAPHQLLASAGIDDLASGRERASEWVSSALTGANPQRARLLRDTATAIRPKDWPVDMSAELDTLARVQRKGFALARGDIAVLVCSDTRDGLLSGVWNGIAMAGGDLSRVRYVADASVAFGEDLRRGLRGSIVLARVRGMDAGDDGFRDAMRGLGLLARHLFTSKTLRKDDDFQFILSGGYKAAIPYLIGLAEAVRSVDASCLRDLGVPELAPAPDEPYPVTAWVQHDTADDRALPVRLPLRRLNADWVREETSGYNDSGIRKERLASTFLEGYAFDVKSGFGGKRYVLTSFGAGLAALLGTARARAGD